MKSIIIAYHCIYYHKIHIMKIIKYKQLSKNLKPYVSGIIHQRLATIGGLIIYPSLYIFTNELFLVPQTFLCASLHLTCIFLLKKQLKPLLEKEYSDFYNYKTYNIKLNGDIIFDKKNGIINKLFGVKIQDRDNYRLSNIESNNNMQIVNSKINYHNINDNIRNDIDKILYQRKFMSRFLLGMAIIPMVITNIVSLYMGLSIRADLNYIISISGMGIFCFIMFNCKGSFKHIYDGDIYERIKILGLRGNYKYAYVDIIGNIVFKYKRGIFDFRKNLLHPNFI